MPGYDEAFDTTECPYGDPTQPPDIDRARKLIEQAGADGADVTVWGNTDEPSPKVTEAYADMLNDMGLDAGVADHCQHVARRAAGRIMIDHDVGHERFRQQQVSSAISGAQSCGLPRQQSFAKKSISSRSVSISACWT